MFWSYVIVPATYFTIGFIAHLWRNVFLREHRTWRQFMLLYLEAYREYLKDIGEENV